MADDYKYHIDHHGSLVRPPELLAARASGDAKALAAAEEEAIVAVAHELRRLTLSAVGDGQFRREHFESVVYDHVDGFGPAAGPAPVAEAAGIPAARRRTVASDPKASGRLAHDEVAPVLATVDRPVFVQLPAPGYLAALGSALSSSADMDAVLAGGAALAAVLHAEIEALAAEGVAYVALANPLYPPLLTVAGRERLEAAGLDADAVLRAMLEADRAAVAGLTAHETFRLGLDLTDSGPLPTTAQGYDPKAVDTLLDENPFHRLCVDFPADPGARLPLERVKPGLVLSLGVVDVADPSPEAIEDLLARMDPVIDDRGEDDVAIATNGGFAQSAAGPLMTEEAQTAKLRLVETVARYYWGNEILRGQFMSVDLRSELATATRILASHQLIGMFGHVSVLTDDPGKYLVCPGAGARKDRCRSTDVLQLGLDDEFEPGRPLELYMHSEAHRLKPQLKSLIHVHSPALVALSAMAEVPTQLLMLHASFWPESMPVWEEAELVRDRPAAQRLVEILGDAAIALLRWHGAVIVGTTLREAVFRAILAEEHARQLVTALTHGRPLAPVPKDVDRGGLYSRVLSPRTHDMHWDYASTFVEIPPGARG